MSPAISNDNVAQIANVATLLRGVAAKQTDHAHRAALHISAHTLEGIAAGTVKRTVTTSTASTAPAVPADKSAAATTEAAPARTPKRANARAAKKPPAKPPASASSSDDTTGSGAAAQSTQMNLTD